MYKMMKKGMFPRIAAVMLMLTLLSTCVISGTFAKYTFTDNTSATARVAKWGVTIEASPTDESGAPFKNSYATNGKVNGYNGVPLENAVLSTEAVVAPGTSGGLGAINLSGKPEVAVKISYKVTELKLENWTVEEGEYCPLIFKVGNQTYQMGETYTTVSDLADAVKAAITAYSANYEAGTDLSKLSDASNVVISWDWPIEGDNAKDTELGNAKTPATITLNLSVTVEQVD